MKSIAELIQAVQKQEHGFLVIQKEAELFVKDNSIPECLDVSKQLLSSEIIQARALATFMLGFIAVKSDKAFTLLKDEVSKDVSWQVQEILAKAFDRYCLDIGYEKALPVIKEWLQDSNPNLRRAVTEGLRIWTGRPYFKENPRVAIRLLSALKADESEYVRKSVGNALRDISKKHKELVKAEVAGWDLTDKQVNQTYKLASKFLDLERT